MLDSKVEVITGRGAPAVPSGDSHQGVAHSSGESLFP